MADLATVRGSFFQCDAPQNNSQFLVHAGLDLRALGWNRVRSCCSHRACRIVWKGRTIGRTTRFARHHACFFCDYPGLPSDALACRATRAARRFGIFLRANAGLHRAHVWKSFLSWCISASLVFRMSFLSGFRWREFCRLHSLAPRTISNRMPCQRVCLFHVLCAVWRSGNHLPGRRRRTPFSIAWNSGCFDLYRLRDWFALDSFWRRNARADSTGVGSRTGKENMPEAETKVFPIEALCEFSTRMFLHFGVPKVDAAQAAEVLAAADLRGIDSHGVARLHSYFDMLTLRRINPLPEINVLRSTPSTATIDGDNGLGLVVVPHANRFAMDMAERFGSGWVSVQNTNHFGIAGYYVLKSLDRNLIGWAMTNSTKLVAILWGAERMPGTNPIAIVFPQRRTQLG